MTLLGCQATSNIGTDGLDLSAVGRAPFCAVVKGLDLRPSRHDTRETQRTMYQLQKAGETCV